MLLFKGAPFLLFPAMIAWSRDPMLQTLHGVHCRHFFLAGKRGLKGFSKRSFGVSFKTKRC